MDLNQNAIDDLEPSFVHGEVVPDEDKALVIVGQDVDDNAQDELLELKEMDTLIQTNIDEEKRFHDMESVIEQVIGRESVSQTDYLTLSKHFPKIEEEVGPVKTFTDEPSKTNFQKTVNFAQDEIAAAKTAVRMTNQTFLKERFNRLKAITSTLFEGFEDCVARYRLLSQRVNEEQNILTDYKRFIIRDTSSNELHDLRACYFTMLREPGKFFQTALHLPLFHTLTDRDHGSYSSFCILVDKLNSFRSFDLNELSIDFRRTERCSPGLTYLNLITFLSTDRLSSFMDMAVEYFVKTNALLGEHLAEMESEEQDNVEAMTFISRDIQQSVRAALDMAQILIALIDLHPVIVEILDRFKHHYENNA